MWLICPCDVHVHIYMCDKFYQISGNGVNVTDLQDIILSHLLERYLNDQIYTYIGDILIAVNPQQHLNIYRKDVSPKILSVCLSVCLSVSIYISIYLSVCLSVYLSVCLSVGLSVYQQECIPVLFVVLLFDISVVLSVPVLFVVLLLLSYLLLSYLLLSYLLLSYLFQFSLMYRNTQKSSLPPHIFMVADVTYQAMIHNRSPQVGIFE